MGSYEYVCWTHEKLDRLGAATLRRDIVRLIRQHAQPGGDVAAAELIVGELLSNVARHAPGRMCADLDWRGSEPMLIVHDGGPGFERNFSDRPAEDEETGRGLNLIHALSRGMTAERGEFGGTRVAAVLPVTRSAAVESPIEPCRIRTERSCSFPTQGARKF